MNIECSNFRQAAALRRRAFTIFAATPRLRECQDAIDSTVSKTFNRLRLLEKGRIPGLNDEPFEHRRFSRLSFEERERIAAEIYLAIDDCGLPLDDAEDVVIGALVAVLH